MNMLFVYLILIPIIIGVLFYFNLTMKIVYGNFALIEILNKNFIKDTKTLLLLIFLAPILLTALLIIYCSIFYKLSEISFLNELIKMQIFLFPIVLFLFQSLIKQNKWFNIISKLKNNLFFINNEQCEVLGLEN